ncbi:uncharacterized protein ACN427_005198 isoform 1-T1 [Glossina fuscipes fuscipes]
MNMEVLAVQNQYSAYYTLATDWKSQLTLSTPTTGGSLKSQPTYKFKRSTAHSKQQQLQQKTYPQHITQNRYFQFNYNNKNNSQQQHNSATNATINTSNSSNKLNCDKTKTTATTTTTTTIPPTSNALNTAAVQELSRRLLEELRAAKSRHLACTEVSLPCDLTPRIALEILRLAREELNGLRECIIYIEFEDEPHNSRRIATLDLNKQRSKTVYEIYVTLRQDHRGWTSLLPQFMKHLSRTITISPDFNITKHKPYLQSFC